MKGIVLALTFALFDCATYRIAPKESHESFISATRVAGEDATFEIAKEKNNFPEGFQCFEPMIFLLFLILGSFILIFSIEASGPKGALLCFSAYFVSIASLFCIVYLNRDIERLKEPTTMSCNLLSFSEEQKNLNEQRWSESK